MKKKLAITLVILALIFLCAGYDVYRSKQFHLTLVSMDPGQAPADGQTPVSLVIKLTDSKGSPVEGHSLFAVPKGGGILSASRVVTDRAGQATYTYYPFKASKLQPVKDVVLQIVDESNSIFIEVNTKTSVTIPLVEPENDAKSKHSLNDIFGE
ncbi:Ig-like domain-containing protein [Paenibacillus nasutitermitis]|nr:hypothetical protein [Paenibacillus nasutitermitis]